MNSFIFFVIANFIAVNCHILSADVESNGVYNYLATVGVEEAERIRKLENELSSPVQRIVGGSSTVSSAVPYQAGLIITLRVARQAVCGGVIIADNRILTGAHCNNDGVSIAQSILVVVGSNLLFSGGTRVQMQSVVMHPGYNPRIIANDLAVLRIPRISYTFNIQAVSLPSGSDLNQNFVGTTARASGYGITRDGANIGSLQSLNVVNLRVITNNECTSAFGNFIQNHHLCTSGSGGVGICGGDTGGPLVVTSVWRDVLIGVGSFTSSRGCQAGAPSGFTRVTSFVPWIISV
ncbi:PREDICTED: collagenase-like [Papilio polytes]|uniref:collagenase-like n=1 Tax=Papilio polytes TaxID=76194 RepID=UPI000676592A|nr:PREDICTED: collagenase-like [Papilio polytes]